MILEKSGQFLAVNFKGVRTRGSEYLDGGCVFGQIKKGRNTNWRETYRNRNEWKKVIEEA
jgi:hypothetical protein